MPETLLLTKHHIPSLRPNLVCRSHLVEKINRGLAGKLTLISAPAGSGKTTLLSQFVARSQEAVAWLSLDRGDDDPSQF